MLDNEGRAYIARAGEEEIFINPDKINRHGLITGATGTGKTVSLQGLAETFSAMGVPTFMADVKGDLSGISRPGGGDGKLAQRAREMGLEEKGYKNRAFPVCFWDVYGQNGLPFRATISDMGPILLARLLELNDVQSGVLGIVFKIADDNGWLLLDLKDLRSMVAHVGEERDRYRASYGQISPASIGAIQRALLRLEDEGGDLFFGEPSLNVMDLLRTEAGFGVINILDATRLINAPRLYSCVLLWLLSELFEQLPEVGDQAKPRLTFFFDEAHLLFNDISPALLQKIEQVVRLIRSRGVGVFFVSQNPSDMPDSILGQLGNRIQHALRAFTPRDQKAVRAAAQAFRPNPAFSTAEAIGNLGVGEALVSFLDEKGMPGMVKRAFILPPEAQVGPITDSERRSIIAASPLAGTYAKSIDRESAYEILSARANARQAEAARAAAMKEEEKARKAMEKAGASRKRDSGDILGDIMGSVVKSTTRAATSAVGRELGRTILRGVLGGLFGGKR